MQRNLPLRNLLVGIPQIFHLGENIRPDIYSGFQREYHAWYERSWFAVDNGPSDVMHVQAEPVREPVKREDCEITFALDEVEAHQTVPEDLIHGAVERTLDGSGSDEIDSGSLGIEHQLIDLTLLVAELAVHGDGARDIC